MISVLLFLYKKTEIMLLDIYFYDPQCLPLYLPHRLVRWLKVDVYSEYEEVTRVTSLDLICHVYLGHRNLM